MKKTFLAVTLAASLGLAACGNAGKEVVVTSSVGDLTQDEFYKEMKSLAGEQLLQQIMVEKILNDKYKVTNEEIDKELASVKESAGEQFETLLSQNGLSEEGLKENIRINLLSQKALEEMEVADEDIQKYYDQASQELHARHILVADEETAKEAIKRINDGEDFADVAKELSSDGSAEKGGDLGWFTVGMMVKEFNDAAYALELNTLSEPVKSQFGYHVIEVTEKRPVEDYGTLEEKKDEIREQLLAQFSMDDVITKLLKDAKVEVKDADLKGAFDKYSVK
ncbi:peptidylprolyl isomerase [Metasolibacillus sp.]|uniref:peptidylprolyl isomerase n=1 Tax=Metasolibacillus sp. TaxID=2703680 RepID=UPI0025D43B27|nr:peptidylprolyl isomerase [Metasolibacillus sp.]MCT6924664.1 peptidylprolyl isomerase [Metasolibacillus sp.]MCT6940866.1 peptidylprolyl isomerase [Metasolibacillus sp.]